MEAEGYVIIDIGTGNVRVAVTSKQGEVLSIERDNIAYVKDKSYPDALHFDPQILWSQVVVLAKKALSQVANISIKAITASSQREGIVLIDENGKSLIGFPNHDHRGKSWEGIIHDKDRVYQLTGRYPSSLFSAMKLVGLRNVQPEVYNRTAKVMSISDWAQFQLCGIHGYEHSQASETLLYDVERMCWSDELCSLFDINKKILPELRLSGVVLGKVKPDYAAEFNIPREASVVVGGADTQLAIKSTQPSDEDIVIVAGTTTPITKITKTYITDGRQRTWTNRHVDEGRFILETNAGVTGLNFQQLKEVFYPNESYEVIEKEMSELKDMECFASLGSLVADEKNSLKSGGFIINVPVTRKMCRASFIQATLWDIACCIKANFETLCEVDNYSLEYVWACGGGIQSPTLRQYIANLINKKVKIRKNYQHASIVGGALVCNEALGIKLKFETAIDLVEPQKKNYSAELQKWKSVREGFKKENLAKEVI